MRFAHAVTAFAVVLIAGSHSALAQYRRAPKPQAAATPYKAVAIVPPAPMTDAGFEAFREALGGAAQKKERAALAKLVVEQGFFWDRDNANRANKKKSGIDNLSTTLGLNSKDGAGWEILYSYADDPTASPSPAHKTAFCSPAEPAYNTKEFAELLKTTNSDASEWGYPVSTGIEVRAAAHANAPVIEKLELTFVRVAPEATPSSAAYLRIITPAGKAGFVTIDNIGPLGNDQICYVKDSGGWKVGGFIGGGEPP